MKRKITKRKVIKKTTKKTRITRRKNPDENKVILGSYFLLTLNAITNKINNDPKILFNLSTDTLHAISAILEKIAEYVNIKTKKSSVVKTSTELMLYIKIITIELQNRLRKNSLIIYDLSYVDLRKISIGIFSVSKLLGMKLQSPPNEDTPDSFKQFLLNAAQTSKFFDLGETKSIFSQRIIM